jgi:hypothetical protein
LILLQNLDSNKLSYGIRSLSPMMYDTVKVKNKLIDGSYHTQIIGNPVKYFTFEILSNQIQVDVINLAVSKGELLKLIIDDKYYIGMIEEIEEWTLLALDRNDKTKTIYSTTMRFNISQEGTL